MRITTGYHQAIITGNSQSAMARVNVGFNVDMGVSVYVKGNTLHKGGNVSHYAARGTMTVTERENNLKSIILN